MFAPSPKFGPENLLLIFNLLQPNQKTDPTLARHTLGPDLPTLPHQENPLASFELLPRLLLDHPTHNREVKGRVLLAPPLFIKIIEL